ncbi:MAG: DUF4443 domain-containing protein [Promethearchaeia archaeon]
MFEDFEKLFESETVKPTFELVHIILAIYIFGENEKGMGRYKLQKELNIGSGTARSLITKLREKINLIELIGENNRKGHKLSEKGKEYYKKIKKKIPILLEIDFEKIQELIIKAENIFTYFCIVRNSADKILSGIEQRDAAIKIGGKGATCLIYNGNYLVFPEKYSKSEKQSSIKVEDKINNYFKELITKNNVNLEKNDVIIIGLGENLETARLSALNAALTII